MNVFQSHISILEFRLAAALAQQSRAQLDLDAAKAVVREVRKELSQRRASDKAEARRQAKPAYEGVRARKAEADKRRAEALSMRQAGLTFAAIGDAFGVTPSRAREIVKNAERIERYRSSRECEA